MQDHQCNVEYYILKNNMIDCMDCLTCMVVQLQQIKSGVITWVCTNSTAAPDASVTAKAVCDCQIG